MAAGSLSDAKILPLATIDPAAPLDDLEPLAALIGDEVRVMSTGRDYSADRIGRFTPKMVDCDRLATGEVGFVIDAW